MEKTMRILSWAARILLMSVGALCILFSTHILRLLPYLLGATMVAYGVVLALDSSGLRRDGWNGPLHSEGLSRAILLGLVGVVTLLKGAGALSFIGVSWGLLGLMKAGRALAGVIDAVAERRSFIGNLLRAVIEIALSCLLLFYPEEKVQTHIEILGLEILFYALLKVRSGGPARRKKSCEDTL